MVNSRSKRLSAAASASVDFPNPFAHSFGRSGRGALFTGNSADAVEEQSPNVTSAAFGASSWASDMRAENEYVSAAIDHHDTFLTPLCYRQRDFARFREIDFVIIGCGGVGSQIAVQLATLGARHFLLADADRIGENNLSDLPWAGKADLGCLKTDKLATYLAARFSANVFALPETAEGAVALRLIADYADNPFVVLAGEDSLSVEKFVAAGRASAAGMPPYLQASRYGGYRTTSSAVVVHAVSQIAQQCLSKHSASPGRRWIANLKTDQGELRSPSKNLASGGPFVAPGGAKKEPVEIADAINPAAPHSQMWSLAPCSLIYDAGETGGMNGELTISEALRDPLIAMVMRADGVTSEELKQLLETAARRVETNLSDEVQEQ
ncbi:hypothetical protein J2X71_001900 [Rhizobium sp. 1399]|jgi:hypothetical protein|nr:hypothetical protein [Rhizobium sp. 1399]